MAASTLAHKRKRDTDVRSSVTPPLSSSPIKRHKVSIDTSMNKYHNSYQDTDEKPYLLVREEVKRALLKADGGENEQREAVVGLFTVRPDDDFAPSKSLILKNIEALASMANLLSRNRTLVSALLNTRWVGRDEEFVRVYIRMLGNLVATHTGFIRPVLESLVERFTTLRSSAGQLPDHPAVKRSELLDRLHLAILHVLDKAPSAPAEFLSICQQSFPFHTDSLRVHTDYVSNLLRVSTYQPSLTSEILGLIVDRLMKIDAQMQGDIEDIEDELGVSVVEDVLLSLDKSKGNGEQEAADISDSESEDESDWEEEGSDAAAAAKRVKELKDAIAKMDAILELMFEYYTPFFAKGPGNTADSNAAFDQLLGIFSQTILHTRNSRHTQFLLFHFSQTSTDLVERFATDLVTWTFNSRRSPLLRENAAMYLASLVARGAHIPRELTDDVVDILLHEMERHRKLYEPNCKAGPDLNRWATYYFIAQALLYIFCFRWRDLTIDGDDVDDEDIINGHEFTWKPRLKEILTANIYSPLNPLKVCTTPIVEQFARIAHHLRLMYVFPLLETNRRRPFVVAMTSGSTSIRAERAHQLEAWFPFDPYHLPRSKRWLEGDYVAFKNPPGLDEEDEDEDGTDVSREEVGDDGNEDEFEEEDTEEDD